MGGIWLTVLLAAASLLLTSASETPVTSAWLAVSAALVGGSALFIWYEGRHRDPVLPARLFRSAAFSAAAAGVALSNFAMYLPLLVIPLLLANEGRSPARARRVLRRVHRVGSLITAAGLALVAPRQPDDLLGLIAPLVLAGSGHSLLGPALRVAAVEAAPVWDAGLVSGTFATVRYFGGIASAITFAAIARGEQVDVPAVFIGVAAISVVGALLALRLPGRPAAPTRLPAEASSEAD